MDKTSQECSVDGHISSLCFYCIHIFLFSVCEKRSQLERIPRQSGNGSDQEEDGSRAIPSNSVAAETTVEESLPHVQAETQGLGLPSGNEVQKASVYDSNDVRNEMGPSDNEAAALLGAEGGDNLAETAVAGNPANGQNRSNGNRQRGQSADNKKPRACRKKGSVHYRQGDNENLQFEIEDSTESTTSSSRSGLRYTDRLDNDDDSTGTCRDEEHEGLLNGSGKTVHCECTNLNINVKNERGTVNINYYGKQAPEQRQREGIMTVEQSYAPNNLNIPTDDQLNDGTSMSECTTNRDLNSMEENINRCRPENDMERRQEIRNPEPLRRHPAVGESRPEKPMAAICKY